MMYRFCMLLFSFSLATITHGQLDENSLTFRSGHTSCNTLSGRNQAITDSLLTDTYIKLVHLSNFDSSAVRRYDKILTYDHQVFLVKIQNITPSHVLFLYPFNTDMHALNRSTISQIQYSDGTIDIFLPLPDKNGFSHHLVDTARIIIRNSREWEKVTLTENATDICGMIEMGKVSVNYQADFVNAANDYLERNAGIILKKKAANLNAPVILVINKNYNKAYGDLPSISMEGVIYNYE